MPRAAAADATSVMDHLVVLFSSAASEYDGWVSEKPMQAKLITTMGVNLLADLLAQAIIKAKSKSKGGWASWEALPALRLVLWGLVCTPLVDEWLGFLDSTFGVETDMVTLGKKLFVDQLLFGPFLLWLFLVFVGAFDALTLGTRFADTFVGIVGNVVWGTLAGLVYWAPVTVAIFTVVPNNFRLLVLSLCGLLYNIWLSLWVSGQAQGKEPPSKKDAATDRAKKE